MENLQDDHSLKHRSEDSECIRAFGNYILDNYYSIINFNYDTIIDDAIKRASFIHRNYPRQDSNYKIGEKELFLWGSEELPDLPPEIIRDSHFPFQLARAYGFHFDHIELDQPGVPKTILGRDFYAQENFSTPEKVLILKMHGSTNWRIRMPIHIKKDGTFKIDRDKKIVYLKNGIDYKIQNNSIESMHAIAGEYVIELTDVSSKASSHLMHAQDYNSFVQTREIVPPILYKDKHLKRNHISEIWQKAALLLSSCKRLVVIGYSFPPTDFAAKKLFLESFCSQHLEELIVINPCRTARENAKRYTRIGNGKYAKFDSLDEFLQEESEDYRRRKADADYYRNIRTIS